MQSYLVDLHSFLATWAEILEPYMAGFLVLYTFVPMIYLIIRRTSQLPSKYPSRFFVLFSQEHREFWEERDEQSYGHLVKNLVKYYIYVAVWGILLGFMMQAGTESISALAMIPMFSIGGILVMSIQVVIRRDRVKTIRSRKARFQRPEITDPEELEEVEMLQRFVDALEQKQAQEEN